MADGTVGARFFRVVTVETKAHVDFVGGNHAIHLLDRSMAALTFNSGPNVRLMRETYEIRERIDSCPMNLERLLDVYRPRRRHRLQSSSDGSGIAVTAHASLNWWNTRRLRTPSILMAVLAGYFLEPRVNSMAKRNGLDDVIARGPRTLRERDSHDADSNARCGKDEEKSRHVCASTV